MSLHFRIFLIIFVLASFYAGARAQSADNRTSIFSKPGESEKEDRPKGLKETFEKMRIEKEKKDHDEMIERGDEALRISGELQKSVAKNGKLSDDDLAKLALVEKLVKKVRDELGGENDDQLEDADRDGVKPSIADAVESLRSTTLTLFDELKKTTRFTISAAAIHSTNAVLKFTRFLRFGH